MFVILHVVHKK